MKRRMGFVFVLMAALVFTFGNFAFAGEQATIDEVYEKVLEGVQVITELGDEGLEVFNLKESEFTWKNTNLSVADCEKEILVATPNDRVRGMDSNLVVCKKTGKLALKEACESKNPAGHWIEYWWPNKVTGTDERRLTFNVPVPGTPYVVNGSVWDDKTSVDELNKSLK